MIKFLLVATLALAVADKVSYKGYHVMTIGPFKSEADVKSATAFANLFMRTRKIQFWKDPSGLKAFDVIVAPELVQFYIGVLQNTPYKVHKTDLQQWIDQEARVNERQRAARLEQYGDAMPLDAPQEYLRFDDIVLWTRNLANAHANARVEELPQRSFEGRTIVALKIGSHDGTKRKIWVDCGIHAREWISPATCLWIMDKMLNQYSSNADSRFMVDNFDWIFIPGANPDGYEWTHTGDRMWRKTRTTHGDDTCLGADPNRNWDAQWRTNGISTDPCSDVYCGASMWSEESVRALRDYFQANRANMVEFLTVHSFTQIWLTPFAWQVDTVAENDAEIRTLARSITDAIFAVNGRFFEIGTVPERLGSEASGSSMDYAKFQNVRFAYAPELRPASPAEGGFIIPAIPNIRESGEEIFAGFAAMCRNMPS